MGEEYDIELILLYRGYELETDESSCLGSYCHL